MASVGSKMRAVFSVWIVYPGGASLGFSSGMEDEVVGAFVGAGPALCVDVDVGPAPEPEFVEVDMANTILAAALGNRGRAHAVRVRLKWSIDADPRILRAYNVVVEG